MDNLLIILFWSSVFCVFHTYILFPLIVIFFGKFKKQNFDVSKDDLPSLSIVIAAYNEENVIAQKLDSTIQTNYNLDKIEILIGSDNSNDATNSIIKKYQEDYKNIHLFEFNTRQGKAKIINQLVEVVKNDIIIFTDANVFFERNTINELVKHFDNDKIGQVGGNIINTNVKKTGISIQEKKYLDIEKKIKYNEGKLWGTMIGAFGGCYAMRKKLYKNIPKDYLMDDFYVSMHVLEKDYKAIFEPNAICLEDVSDKISEEFRRKVRISAGNFQNLYAYKHLLLKPNIGLIFSFVSHKILRWITPVFILLSILISYYLGQTIELYRQLFILQLILFVPLPLDFIIKKVGVNISLLRYITHFYSMNLALFIGMFKYLLGIKTNIWKPTERNQ